MEAREIFKKYVWVLVCQENPWQPIMPSVGVHKGSFKINNAKLLFIRPGKQRLWLGEAQGREREGHSKSEYVKSQNLLH